MPGKRITIDDLAAMTRHGFDDMLAGFALFNKRFDNIETRLADLDTRLGTVERLLTSNRIERLEDDVRLLKTKAGLR